MVKNLSVDAGNAGLIPGLGRSPGKGNDNPLQYSCLENSLDRGAWQATVPGVIKSQTLATKQLQQQLSLAMEGTQYVCVRRWDSLRKTERKNLL